MVSYAGGSNLRVLVTGGSGFIGSHLVEALVKEKHDVTVVDDFSSGRLENISHLLGTVKVARTNVAEYLFPVNGNFDIVYHLAARPWAVTKDSKEEKELFNSNVDGTYNILRQCSKDTLFVFTSSANLYGEGRKLKEDAPIKPSSFYGYTKAVAEDVITLGKVPYIIFRLGTVVGPRGRCFPNRLVWCIVNQVPVQLFNSGETVRDIIDVRDVVKALIVAPKLNKEASTQRIFNLGRRCEISGKELVSKASFIAEQRGYKVLCEEVPWSPQGFVKESTLKTTLSKYEVWKPTYTLDQTLRTLFDYYEKGGIEPPSWESL